MNFKTQILLAFLCPILLTTSIIFFTSFYLYYQASFSYVNKVQTYVLQQAAANLKGQSQAISANIWLEYQNLMILQYAQNNFLFKIKAKVAQLKQNSAFTPLFINQNNNQEVNSLIQKSRADSKIVSQYNSYYHRNITSYDSLAEIDKQNIQYSIINELLSRAIKIQNQTDIVFRNYYNIFENDGLSWDYPCYIEDTNTISQLYKKSSENQQYLRNLVEKQMYQHKTNLIQNKSLRLVAQAASDNNCEYDNYQGKFPFEWRCRPWYLEAKSINKVVFVEPYLDIFSQLIINTICASVQDLSQQVFAVSCFDFQISILQKKITQNQSSINQLYNYLIYPGSRMPFIYPNMQMQEIYTIDDYEFKNSHNKIEEVKQFQQKTQIFMEKIDNSSNPCSLFFNPQDDDNLIQYKKNKKTFWVLIRKVSICQKEKLNDLMSSAPDKKITNKLVGYFCYTISQQYVEDYSYSLLQNVLIINLVGILSGLLLSLSIFYIVVFYTLNISQQIIESIDQLTHIIQTLDLNDLDKAATDQDFSTSSEIFNELSKEFITFTSMIYRMIFMVKYANLAFQSGDNSTALLQYANAIIFFQQIGNRQAINVCLNNMGNIHLKCQRFKEAIDLYKESIQDIKQIWKQYNKRYNIIDQILLYSDEEYRRLSYLLIVGYFHKAEAQRFSALFNLTETQLIMKVNSEYEVWKKIEDSYKKSFQLLKDYLQINENYSARLIYIQVQLAFCHLQIKSFQKAEAYLADAENELNKWVTEKQYNSIQENQKQISFQEQLQQFIIQQQKSVTQDIFFIPKDILLQKILLIKAFIQNEYKNYYNSSLLFTDTIITGDFYDPLDRKICLLNIKQLLKVYQEDTSTIDHLLIKFNPLVKDVMFLLDNSSKMSNADKLMNAIYQIQKIFEKYIGLNDRVGYSLYGDSEYEMFPLIYKQQNQEFISHFLDLIPTTGGRQNTLKTLLKVLQKMQNYNFIVRQQHDQSKNNIHISYKKVLILLTDGSDLFIDMIQNKLLIQQIKNNIIKQQIEFIIIALTDDKNTLSTLQQFIQDTSDGTLIIPQEQYKVDSLFINMQEKEDFIMYQLEYLI